MAARFFQAAPNFEAPTDANGDKVYVVIVQASDGGLTSLQAILVTVTDAFEGDYNSDGTVDAADYTVWRNQVGTIVPAFSNPDGSGNGIVDQADHKVWKSNFGNTQSMGSGAAVAFASLEPAIQPQQSIVDTVTVAGALEGTKASADESSTSTGRLEFHVERPRKKESRAPERRAVQAGRVL